MSQSVYFNGELLTIPGAYSTVDTGMMTTKGDNAGAKIIAFVGESSGGEPETVQFFTEPTSARKVLRSGDLLKACEKAWNPVSKTKSGVSLGGANMIACVRSNKATKSSHIIKKQASDENPQLKFISTDWGENTAHQIKMVNGTLNGTKKLVVYDQSNGVYENVDNIGNLFTINYKGEQPYAELNIFVDGSKSMYFQTKVGANAGSATEDIKIKLDTLNFKSLKALILQLQSYENYVVSALNPYNNRLAVTDLDFVDKANIKLDSGQNPYRVTAIYADMQSKLSVNSHLIRLESYDKAKGEIANFDYVTLTGGTNGTSPASWVKYFDMLSNFDVTYIVPLTSDVSIHAELLSHITRLSGNLGKERRGIVGGGIAETVSETIVRARDLTSDRMQVVHGGFYDFNSNNELELYPAYILAAQHAGRVAFLEDGESATHDVYRMSAPEYKLEKDEIEQLISGGCLAFEFVLGKNGTSQSYVRLVQDLTTNTTATNTIHTERATGALSDSINKEIRESLDELLTGKRISVSDLASAKNKVISILENRKRKNHIIDFKDIYLTKEGTITVVHYYVAPAEPNNFVLVTGHYYSETITV